MRPCDGCVCARACRSENSSLHAIHKSGTTRWSSSSLDGGAGGEPVVIDALYSYDAGKAAARGRNGVRKYHRAGIARARSR